MLLGMANSVTRHLHLIHVNQAKGGKGDKKGSKKGGGKGVNNKWAHKRVGKKGQ
jgi:hypothetical protein